jgi:hypothetical protein
MPHYVTCRPPGVVPIASRRLGTLVLRSTVILASGERHCRPTRPHSCSRARVVRRGFPSPAISTSRDSTAPTGRRLATSRPRSTAHRASQLLASHPMVASSRSALRGVERWPRIEWTSRPCSRRSAGPQPDLRNTKPRRAGLSLAHWEGFEPPTLGSVDRCSIQLSYQCMGFAGRGPYQRRPLLASLCCHRYERSLTSLVPPPRTAPPARIHCCPCAPRPRPTAAPSARAPPRTPARATGTPPSRPGCRGSRQRPTR